MKYASQMLREEHDRILLALDILEAMTGRLCVDRTVDPGDLYDMMQFINIYVNDYHNIKEETLYYPVLKKETAPFRNGAIRQIMQEHRQARQYCADLETALQTDRPQVDIIVAAASAYIDLMRAHIQKENEMLLPLGDQIITGAEQADMAQAFLDYDQKQMNHRTQEILYGMLAGFDEKYLSSAG